MAADGVVGAVRAVPEAARSGPGRRVIWALVGVLLTSFLSALDQTIVSVSAFPIATALDPADGVRLMPWLITAYLLGSTATQPLYGKISDLYGAKKVFLVAAGIFLAASALCGLAGSMGQLIAFRAVQGIGAGGLYSVSLILLARAVPARDRAKFQGVAGLVIALATVGGPLAGGFLTGDHALFGIHTSWRWVFYVNLPIGLVGIAMVATLLKLPPATGRGGHRIDFAGALLVVAATCSLLLMTTWGGVTYAWSDPAVLGLAAAGAILLGLFARWQTRAAEPLMPPPIFRERTVAVAAPMLFVTGFALMGAITYAALYLQLVKGMTPTATGLRLMPMIVGILVASIGSGIVISARDGRYKIFPVIGTAVAAGGLGVLGTLRADSSYGVLATGLLLLGLGLGLLMQVLVQAVQNAVPDRDLGAATTTATFFRTMGQSFGAAVFGAVLTNQFAARVAESRAPGLAGRDITPETLAGLPEPARAAGLDAFTAALGVVFVSAAAIMLVAFLVSFLLKEMRLREIDDIDAVASEIGDRGLSDGAAAGADDGGAQGSGAAGVRDEGTEGCDAPAAVGSGRRGADTAR
ncbi:MDR family MFS transporter [Streptomyces sp. NPDC050392]|uniref:MDR family MFS transporter n=1 Tax=Streptomyces sp. NPDC050392 TaxID=3155782 RepID=UPI0034252210